MTGSDHLRNAGIDWSIILKLVIGKNKGVDSIQVSHDQVQCSTVANVVMTVWLGMNVVVTIWLGMNVVVTIWLGMNVVVTIWLGINVVVTIWLGMNMVVTIWLGMNMVVTVWLGMNVVVTIWLGMNMVVTIWLGMNVVVTIWLGIPHCKLAYHRLLTTTIYRPYTDYCYWAYRLKHFNAIMLHFNVQIPLSSLSFWTVTSVRCWVL